MSSMAPSLRPTSLVLVAAIIVVVGAVGVQLLAAPPNGGVNSTNLTAACNHQFSTAGSPNRASVHEINSSRAVLCLNYARGSQGNASFFNFILAPWIQNGSQVENVNNQQCPVIQGKYQCPGFTVVPSPESAVFKNSTEEIALAYTITAAPSASGLYIFFITPGNPIYLSFGHAPTTVFLTAWTSGPRLPSGVLPPNYNVTGGTNVDLIAIPWA
jgi:hypothetical protein